MHALSMSCALAVEVCMCMSKAAQVDRPVEVKTTDNNKPKERPRLLVG